MRTLLDFIFSSSPLIYIFISFLEHNCTTIRNISMVLGRFIEQVNAECCMQGLQLCLSTFSNYYPPPPPPTHTHSHPKSFSEQNSSAIRDIFMILGRITEQIRVKCRMQELQLCLSSFLIMSPDPYFHFISDLYLSNHLNYFNDTLKDHTTGQRGMSHAKIKTLLFFIF